jgi:hypothetical protein
MEAAATLYRKRGTECTRMGGRIREKEKKRGPGVF